MKTLQEIKEKALLDNIPIIEDAGLEILLKTIKENNLKRILEVGSAVGYSSLMMASLDPEIRITTLEKNESIAKIAKDNINEAGYSKQINQLWQDALEYHDDNLYDLLFIDGAKTKNKEFFLLFENNVKKKGFIVIDDIDLHGLVDLEEELTSKRMKPMVKKIREFREWVLKNPQYDSKYYHDGDGIIVCQKLF